MAALVAPQAEADLDGIWLYVAKESGSMDVATRTVDSITNRFLFLSRFPHAGRTRHREFGAGMRSFPRGRVCDCVLGRRRGCAHSARGTRQTRFRNALRAMIALAEKTGIHG